MSRISKIIEDLVTEIDGLYILIYGGGLSEEEQAELELKPEHELQDKLRDLKVKLGH